jgi:endo-1,4-beta-xylanase
MRAFTRRAALAAPLALLAPPPALAAPTPGLAEAAATRGLLFGASIGDEAFTDSAYADLYRRETRLVATDIALKFDYLRPDRDHFDFARADQIVAAARDSGKLVRGHTLIWNDLAPGWLRGLSRAELERVFDQHIDTVVQRYAGKLHSWDVVNEPFWPMAGEPGGWRPGPWLTAFGPAYIERAFRRVRAIDPKVRLTLNEAQCENDHEWGRSIRAPFKNLVEDLLHKGVPLDAVGFQSHLQPQWPRDYAAFADYASQFGRKGLEVYLSEFDVNDQSLPDDTAKRKNACAAIGGEFLAQALKIEGLKLLVTWQLADRYSYYREIWRHQHPDSQRLPTALPFGDDLQPNPLHRAMLQAMTG